MVQNDEEAFPLQDYVCVQTDEVNKRIYHGASMIGTITLTGHTTNGHTFFFLIPREGGSSDHVPGHVIWWLFVFSFYLDSWGWGEEDEAGGDKVEMMLLLSYLKNVCTNACVCSNKFSLGNVS